MKREIMIVSGQVLDDETYISMAELCQISHLSVQEIIEMVEYGLIEPHGPTPADWQFSLSALRRLKTALRLRQDLDLNLSGAVLLVEVLEELHQLRRKLG